MLRPGPAVPIERPPTVEEVIDELRARLTLVALRAQEDGEVARVRGPSAAGLGLPTVLSSRLSGEWPGGVAPPGSLRTRREPLDSPGSHRPAVGARAESPMGEETGLT
jgi:hypothetical protein